jgi:hypothetical protein
MLVFRRGILSFNNNSQLSKRKEHTMSKISEKFGGIGTEIDFQYMCQSD